MLILFGDYRGTCKQGGFHWGNPFYANGPASQAGGTQSQWSWGKKNGEEQQNQAGPKKLKRYKVSLRARTLNGDRLKVNDQRGNPVEIAVVVVWRIIDTAQALFDVDDYENYVQIQSEAAVRHLATAYPYDHIDGADETTLRGGGDKVTADLPPSSRGASRARASR